MNHAAAAFEDQHGIALLGTMIVVLVLALLASTLLNLSGQDGVSAAVERDFAQAQHLADAAGELIVGWFHGSPPSPGIAETIAKRRRNASGAPSFFDSNGQSQFAGTAERPDLALRGNFATDGLISGLSQTLSEVGTIQELKLYASSRPGLLCTVETTVSVGGTSGMRQSVIMQLAALEVPPIRAAVQVGRGLGDLAAAQESPVSVHWGDLKVRRDLVLRTMDAIPAKTALGPVTGQSYDETIQREDRWMEAWIGGHVQVTHPTVPDPGLPANVHTQQQPVPGVNMDLWPYEQLKRIAKQHGRYVAIDRDGWLYPQGVVTPGHGVSADEFLRSMTVGDQLGFIFVDTLDQTAPRLDNLGTLTLHAPYVEGILVVQGHVVLAPAASGEALSALSPPQVSPDGSTARRSVHLSGVQLNGLLYASGNITISGRIRVFGSVTVEGTIASGATGSTLEVWYNFEHGQGLYGGLPVVYPAPGTWRAQY